MHFNLLPCTELTEISNCFLQNALFNVCLYLNLLMSVAFLCVVCIGMIALRILLPILFFRIEVPPDSKACFTYVTVS